MLIVLMQLALSELLVALRLVTVGTEYCMTPQVPSIQARSDLSKEQFVKKDEQTTMNHFHEKLLKRLHLT
ncbi:hypothetical protein ACET3Z_008592 [Daucus carota]